MNEKQKETLFDFPCEFPIKVVGKASKEFETTVTDIVRRHVPDLSDEAIRRTGSREGKFVSVTLTITATDRAQLDDIYRELSACEGVLMAL